MTSWSDLTHGDKETWNIRNLATRVQKVNFDSSDASAIPMR